MLRPGAGRKRKACIFFATSALLLGAGGAFIAGRGVISSRQRPSSSVYPSRGTSTSSPSQSKAPSSPSKKEKGKSAAQAAEAAVESVLSPEPYNACLCHSTADFDSLAGAVALTKLWGLEEPDVPSFCVLTTAHPSVEAFLALHVELFAIRSLRTLSPANVRRVGVCDAQTRDRLGQAVELIDLAEQVYVFDHHMGRSSDLSANAVVSLQHVGSVTTVLVEMLRERGVPVNEAEATLFALGIHSDTGSLTFDGSTDRDAEALCWLMKRGCNQAVLTEFLPAHAPLSAEQLQHLQTGLNTVSGDIIKGLSVGTIILEAAGFTPGMARVAQMLLECTGLDVLVVGVLYPLKPSRPQSHLNIICRARIGHAAALGFDKMDFGKLLAPLGGGGHAGAAAATVKLAGSCDGDSNSSMNARDKAAGLIRQLLERLEAEQLQSQETVAEDFMTSRVQTCPLAFTAGEAAALLHEAQVFAAPVVEESGVLVGLVTRTELTRLLQGPGDAAVLVKRPVVEVMAKQKNPSSKNPSSSSSSHGTFFTVTPTTPLREIRGRMAKEGGSGRAVVIDGIGRVRGIITRTDLLRQYHYYQESHRVDAYFEWKTPAAGVAGGDGDPCAIDFGWMGGYI
jgi:tRNA nucleotidyltransferase (CCA-adding enzyme)